MYIKLLALFCESITRTNSKGRGKGGGENMNRKLCISVKLFKSQMTAFIKNFYRVQNVEEKGEGYEGYISYNQYN